MVPCTLPFLYSNDLCLLMLWPRILPFHEVEGTSTLSKRLWRYLKPEPILNESSGERGDR